MAKIIDRVKVEVNTQPVYLVGEALYPMVVKLKKAVHYTHRSFDAETKTWYVFDISLEEFNSLMSDHGLEVVDEENIFDQEDNAIATYQNYFKNNESDVRDEIRRLDEKVAGFSFSSKSQNKARYMRESALLGYCLKYAQKPIEELTEPEINSLRKGHELMTE